MTTTTTTRPALRSAQRPTPRGDLADPAFQAFWLLRIGFIVAPIAFGLDKYFHVLVNWDKYLAPEFTDLFNTQAHTLMYYVGAIEIVAGLVVALRPRFGGYLVAAWLAGIITNLLLMANYYDVALRDFGLLLAALTLARLATAFPVGHRAGHRG
ncbi:MAG: hypothetical protein ACT452_08250 [Microthrixaceae bacterium]